MVYSKPWPSLPAGRYRSSEQQNKNNVRPKHRSLTPLMSSFKGTVSGYKRILVQKPDEDPQSLIKNVGKPGCDMNSGWLIVHHVLYQVNTLIHATPTQLALWSIRTHDQETKATHRIRSSGLVDSFQELQGSMQPLTCDRYLLMGYVTGMHLQAHIVIIRHHLWLICKIVTSGCLYRDTVPLILILMPVHS